MFKRIDHVEIVTDPLDRTVQIYTEVWPAGASRIRTLGPTPSLAGRQTARTHLMSVPQSSNAETPFVYVGELGGQISGIA